MEPPYIRRRTWTGHTRVVRIVYRESGTMVKVQRAVLGAQTDRMWCNSTMSWPWRVQMRMESLFGRNSIEETLIVISMRNRICREKRRDIATRM